MDRAALIELVYRIRTVPEDAEQLLDILKQNVPHPNPSDLIFYPKRRDKPISDADIVDEALAWKPIAL